MSARPQQQQSSGPRPRILRIGVLLGGKLVEERLIRDHKPVSIGQSRLRLPIHGVMPEAALKSARPRVQCITRA